MSDPSADYPLISAILLAGRTPVLDILAAIDCFRTQTYPYKELVIVNNAPSQFDAAALNIAAERDIFLIDTPMPYFAGMARNYGIAAANGKIIAQFDPDYWHAPKRLEIQVATLADNQAHVAVLTSTLAYSFVSGRGSYLTNERNAILGTMVFVRPANIDYPNIDKQEELGILEKMQKAEMKIISLPATELACKLYLTRDQQIRSLQPVGLTKPHASLLRRILKDRRVS
jgi:glycosyltransferase involved in cell wall biosynthesis